MAMGTTAGLLEAMPDRRTFVLSRAGFAGIQRYAANWMGDNHSRWDHLWLSMPMAMGFGLSGQAVRRRRHRRLPGPPNAELFLRWMQYGTLTPFCRNHSEIGNVDQYAWTWGDAVRDLVREAIELRYRLLPYLYAAFMRRRRRARRCSGRSSSTTSTTRRCATSTTSTCSGRDLLVAPVRRAGHDRAPRLPARGRLVRLAHRRAADGRRYVVAPTPMDRIPIFARGGAVIPMWPEAPPSTAGHHPRSSSCTSSSPRRRAPPVPARGGRRLTFAALEGARTDDVRGDPPRRRVTLRGRGRAATATPSSRGRPSTSWSTGRNPRWFATTARRCHPPMAGSRCPTPARICGSSSPPDGVAGRLDEPAQRHTASFHPGARPCAAAQAVPVGTNDEALTQPCRRHRRRPA